MFDLLKHGTMFFGVKTGLDWGNFNCVCNEKTEHVLCKEKLKMVSVEKPGA